MRSLLKSYILRWKFPSRTWCLRSLALCEIWPTSIQVPQPSLSSTSSCSRTARWACIVRHSQSRTSHALPYVPRGMHRPSCRICKQKDYDGLAHYDASSIMMELLQFSTYKVECPGSAHGNLTSQSLSLTVQHLTGTTLVRKDRETVLLLDSRMKQTSIMSRS